LNKDQKTGNPSQLFLLFFSSYTSLIILIYFLDPQFTYLKSDFLNQPIVLPVLFPVLLLFFFYPIYTILTHLNSHMFQRIEESRIFVFFQKYSLFFILLFSTIAAFALFGNTLNSKFGLIDDHEIIQFLGPDKKIGFSEIPAALRLTEVGNFGSQERFRPVYYLLRILESILWGNHPALWYLSRLVILSISLSLTWILISKFTSKFTSGFIIAYLLTFICWVEIFARLGPSETYITLGLPIYLWGFLRIYSHRKFLNHDWFAALSIILGTLLCVGSKENMVILAIPSLLILFWGVRNHEWTSILSATLSILFSLFIVCAIYLLLHNSGTDIYQSSINPIQRLHEAFSSYYSIFTNPLLYILALIGIYLLLLFFLRKQRRIRQNAQNSLLILTVLFFFVFYQILFYHGNWPSSSRYDYPGLLYIPVIVIILFSTLKILLEEFQINQAKLISNFVTAFAILMLTISSGYSASVSTISMIVSTTNQFNVQLNSLIHDAISHPKDIIVLESSNVWDYERIFSYQVYLLNNGVTNPITLRIHGYTPQSIANSHDVNLVQEVELSQELEDWSNNGHDHLLPLKTLQNYGQNCISVMMSAEVETKCQISE
jgi:hypothetical protein